MVMKYKRYIGKSVYLLVDARDMTYNISGGNIPHNTSFGLEGTLVEETDTDIMIKAVSRNKPLIPLDVDEGMINKDYIIGVFPIKTVD